MLGISELWIILILALLFFGGSQIPKLARSLGQARKEFEEGQKEGQAGNSESNDNNEAKDDDK